MIRLLIIITSALLILSPAAFAQQDQSTINQYMFSNMAFNPGYAGSKDAICASALLREQWVGFNGAPSTSLFDIHLPVRPFKISSGVGLTFINDVLGYEKNYGMSAAYAYRMDIKNGDAKLGIGVSAGFLNKSMNVTSDDPNNPSGWVTPEDAPGTDAAIPNTKESAMTFDLGFGLYYKAEKLYLGLSSTHITQSKLKYSKGKPSYTRNYFLTAGYDITLPNPSFELLPSVLIVTDGRTSVFDFNSIIVYNKRVWGGVSYRLKTAIIGMVGIELKNGINIGYSYSFETFDVMRYNSGSHEIRIGYCFNVVREKIPHKYKSVRFL
jgi:type IX secretion system PorP/SprF family membrane protein